MTKLTPRARIVLAEAYGYSDSNMDRLDDDPDWHQSCYCGCLHRIAPGPMQSCGSARCHPPMRLQLSRTKGWRLPPAAKSVARPTRWGNPWRAGSGGVRYCGPVCGEVGRFSAKDIYTDDIEIHAGLSAEQAAVLYRQALEFALSAWPGESADEIGLRHELAAALESLRGYDLACWCPLDGAPCHATVLLRLANRVP